MNLLIDRPPDTVKIGGAEYAIRSDFRTSILFELLMQDRDVPEMDKVLTAINLYFPGGYPIEEDIREVFRAIIWFYRCGRSDKEQRGDDRKSGGESASAQAYSFDYDDEYIYAAFRQQYGINLAAVRNLHWWEFRAMFKALDHNCAFVKIMGYRTTKITSDMSKKEKAFLRRMKSVHALPVPESERQESEALIEALMNGGDLTDLLD